MGSQHKIFLERAPSMRIKNGVVHVVDTCGELDHRLSIEVFSECLARGHRVLDRYAAGERDVVEDG